MPLLSTIRDLHRQKARERRSLALAEGVRLVEEMLTSGAVCKGALVSPTLARTPRGAALQAQLEARGVAIEVIDDAELAAAAATEHPQGVVAVYQPRRWDETALDPSVGHPLVVLDGIQDPGNAGTIARTALAFDAAGILALPGTVDLTNPKVVRAAMGALFALPHRSGDRNDLVAIRERSGAQLWIAGGGGDPIDAPSDAPLVIVLGNEGAGVDPELDALADRRVTIPMSARVESLNVAVAAGIILHLVTR